RLVGGPGFEPGPRPLVQQPKLCCPTRDVNPSPAIELAKNAVDMHLDGTRTKAQSRGDFATAEAAGDESRHLEFAVRQPASTHSGGGETAEALFDLLPELGNLFSDPVRKRPCSEADRRPVCAPIHSHRRVPVAGLHIRGGRAALNLGSIERE